MSEIATHIKRSMFISLAFTAILILLYIFNIQIDFLKVLFDISIFSLCDEVDNLYSALTPIFSSDVSRVMVVSVAYISTYAPLIFGISLFVQIKSTKKEILIAGGDRTDEKCSGGEDGRDLLCGHGV